MLRTEGLGYWYQDKEQPLFQDINLEFEEGQSYAILGHSGTGKTTFLSLIAGLDKPREGDIFLNDRSLKQIGLTNYRRHDVAIVFQAYNLFNYMSPLNNLLTAMAITNARHAGDRGYAQRVLNDLGIGDELLTRNVQRLSGGQQQRVAIARTMCCDAKLVVADEPTGNLDEDNTKEVIDQFQRIAHDQQKCVIIVTHEPDVAARCDHQYRLENKQFVQLD
ncbi:ABC transporter ATP-binding protein [Levilactobacillus parabrevis]|uniref:Peptide ABC transporter ATPase n=1 Tax=Levilactobacillus parabrevis ATCC 53295 TaxID=1267003 RepID=A0A0R1H300_9LACO|nr:ABC transporter ATP-binding protein [Levilactobacillus parabrevis]KRK37658.1 peptide ABC transporter ATPase [Levilactobacillus parabrevis ATCC 53295]KRO06579.1 peptide ABC transporter ATPase [Levilactobacillus parabrevis]